VKARACAILVLLLAAPARAEFASGNALTTAEGPPPLRATQLLDEAYAQLRRHDLAAARRAFAAAGTAGAPAQLVALELGYLALAAQDPEEARAHFHLAASGPDATLAGQAGTAASFLPAHWSADVYAEALGWSRSNASIPLDDVVSTVRLRALWRPSLRLDAHLYGYLQATRDLASKGRGAAGLPEIYTDNYALGGVGVLTRLLQGHGSLYAQIGPAADLIEDGQRHVQTDARAGGMFGYLGPGCRPEASGWQLAPCLDLYADLTYVSRFHHNVIGFGRGRSGLTYLTTGPAAWQLLTELRLGADRNHDYYNNFADAGLLQRWRVAGKLPVEVLVGAHVGRFLGVAGRDPAPAQLGYFDLRLFATTYFGL
jgi:hypothetical protein